MPTPRHRIESAKQYRLRRIAADPLYDRRGHLRKRYGITIEQFDALFADQGNRCAGCGVTAPGGKGWQTHHSHRNKRVLAVLCCRCNRGSGLLGDNPDILRRLAEINDG